MSKINVEILSQLKAQGMSVKDMAAHFGCSRIAIWKRLKTLVPPPESFQRLTDKQRRFVLAKLEGKNNTQAAAGAFEVTSMASAKALGHAMMKDPDIALAIDDLMAQCGLGRRYLLQRLKTLVDHPDGNLTAKGLDMAFRLNKLTKPEEQKNQPVQIFISNSLAQRLNEAAKLVYRDVGDSEPLQLPVGDDGETESDQEARLKDSDG